MTFRLLGHIGGDRVELPATRRQTVVKCSVSAKSKRHAARVMSRATNALSAVVLASGLGGCFSPKVSDAICMRCSNNLCPGSFQCRAGYCVDPSAPKQCSVHGSGGATSTSQEPTAGDGSGPDASMDAGGAPGVGGSTSVHTGDAGAVGAGGSGNIGSGGSGTVGAGGGASAGDSGAGADAGAGGEGGIMIRLTPPAVLCSGQPATLAFSVSGGVAPYDWSITAGGAGLTFVTSADGATVSGVLAAPGDRRLSLAVTDAHGEPGRGSFELDVHETPRITTQTLRSACPSEEYSATLTAAGGDGTSYEWATDLPSDTGFAIDGDQLKGTFQSTSNQSKTLDFKVHVTSAGCVSDDSSLELEEQPADPKVCPSIAVPSFLPDLPAPCLGNPYSEQLTANGPGSNYSWRAVETPPGLDFDPATQTVSGTALGAGTLKVQVTSDGRSVDRSFSVEPRTKCWLAYLAPDSGVARLKFYDPILKRGRVFPSDPNADPVADFHFSPDGRFVVYRSASSAASGLTLVDMSTLTEQALRFEHVTRYAWSDDSGALAVAFDETNGHALGGIDVAAPPSGSPPSYPELQSTLADVHPPLVWIGPSELAFLGTSNKPLVKIYISARSGDVLSSPVPFLDDQVGPGSEIRAGADGLFVYPSEGGDIAYYGFENSYAVAHTGVLVSGTGRYVANATDAALNLFIASNTSEGGDPDGISHDVCTGILAWASKVDRLACLQATTASDADIYLFDVSGGSASTVAAGPIVVSGVSAFPNLVPSGRQRLFSPGGDRFAFTTATRLSVAKVAVGAASVTTLHDFAAAPGADDAVLAFSPTNDRIAEHRGTQLSVFELDDTTSTEFRVDNTLPPAEPCIDDFTAAAGSYCGAERTGMSFAWSHDAGSIAHATAAGELMVVDLSRFEHQLVSSSCGSCVAGIDFAFQP